MSSQKITMYILVGMILGIGAGYLCSILSPDAETAKSIAGYFGLVTEIFLRLIKMIIAPLVFSTLVAGISHMRDTKAIGRIGLKAMAWFVSASFVSLLIGLVMVELLQPGQNLNLLVPDVNAATNLKASSLNLRDFVTHLVPRSVFEAMATNEILQIVVFSLFFGVAVAAMGDRAKIVVAGIEEIAHITLRITGYVMNLAPIAVFCAITAIITTQGLGVLVTYGKFMAEFYFSLLILWVCMVFVGFLVLGNGVWRLVRLIREPFLLAFSTASSEAAYPVTLEQLAKYPISERIISFVLPL
ncbi:MAG: dicarboxylate/amino acid:cation symporter, partial [Acetobacteraceae bacterium]|nr:dicarboxylate/amino acid:cation symporter [Acetobacteraceae bacterium]